MSPKKHKKEDKEKTKHDRVVISWKAPEYIQHQKSKSWYIAAAVIIVLTVLIALFTDNLTLAIAVITFAAVYHYIQTHHPPKNIEVRITEMGIYVGAAYFPYSSISAFWIIYRDGVKTLNLRVANRYHSDVVIQFDGQDPVEVRNWLVGQLVEWEGKEESLSDMFLRLIKL